MDCDDTCALSHTTCDATLQATLNSEAAAAPAFIAAGVTCDSFWYASGWSGVAGPSFYGPTKRCYVEATTSTCGEVVSNVNQRRLCACFAPPPSPLPPPRPPSPPPRPP
jgi:hypothetical protein